MESWQAWRITTGRFSNEIAKRLGRSVNLIGKWGRPCEDYSETGAYNPSDRLIGAVEEVLRQGHPQKDAFAVIYQITSHFDGIFLPPVPRTINTHEITKQIAVSMREAAEAFAKAAEAIEDDEISPNERRAFLREAYEAIESLTLLVRMFEER